MNDDDCQAAEKFFHEKIPLTRAMGVRVVCEAANHFAVEAPLALNFNHLHTAFGGSINAVATLAGYGFLWLELRGTAHVVIANSAIRFLRPVRKTIRAVCQRPTATEWKNFREILRHKEKSRITLRVLVEEDGSRAAEFEGVFVAIAN